MMKSKTVFTEYYKAVINKLFLTEKIDHFPVLHPSIAYGD